MEKKLMLLSAQDVLENAADLIGNRGKERDKPDGERSMARAVAILNAWKTPDTELTEEMGWAFMVCLKFARMEGGVFKLDDYLDATAYCALMTESAVAVELQHLDVDVHGNH
jgi:hypothetical protein